MNLRPGVLSSPRRHRLAAAFILAVAVLGALAAAGWLVHWPPGVFSGSASASAPADAVSAVADLAARNPAALRAALVAGYPVQAGDVAPAGTTIRIQPGSWRQQGDNAIMQAVVTLPGRAPLTETVYLVREEGRWLVLFADPA